MLRLICDVKQYSWGQLGQDSLVADLASCNAGHAADAAQPYAELWMGAHESGPARTAKSDMPLQQWLAHTPLALGPEVLSNYGNTLPFLFKVISIRQALSIQAHPDKVLAKQLHATWPDWYKDDNHKPELALAVRSILRRHLWCKQVTHMPLAHAEQLSCEAFAQAFIFVLTRKGRDDAAALPLALSLNTSLILDILSYSFFMCLCIFRFATLKLCVASVH